MKSIKKITKTVAGSALLVGATLAGAASMGAAQSDGSSGALGDYPAPFVDDEGNVDATVVVGESAKTADVVGGMSVAASLGNAAFTEETVTTSSSAGGSWSATEGTTLSTRNDDLYFGDNLDKVRQTLTEDSLNVLQEVTFRDDGGEATDITNYLNLGSQSVTFGNNVDELDDEDPKVHVPVPSKNSVDDNTHLFSLQASMEDTINMSSDDVRGEEIELFGRTYTISESSSDNQVGDSKLVLYGSQKETTLSTGESTTIEVGGEEVTIKVNAVTDSDTAAITVNGKLREEDEDATFTVNDQQMRLSEVIQTNADQSQGTVTVAVGSEELVLQDGQPIEDDEGDEYEGTYVVFNGASGGYKVGNGVSSLEVFLGAPKDDEDALTAGESFSHPLFENVVYRFEGLNPDASGDSDSVGTVDFSASGEDAATIDFTTDGGDNASLEFAYSDDTANNGGNPTDNVNLADSDDDSYVVKEGNAVQEDEYFAADAGDFAHMYEVTGINRDTTATDETSYSSGDEATVDLRDAVTGSQVEVDLDIANDRDSTKIGNDLGGGNNAENSYVYEGTEVIDGQTYYFEVEPSASNPNVYVAWGGNAGMDGATGGVNHGGSSNGLDVGDHTSLYAPLDAQSGAAVALTKEVSLSGTSAPSAPSDTDFSTSNVTVSTDASGTDGITVDGPSGTSFTVEVYNGGTRKASKTSTGSVAITSLSADTDYKVAITETDEAGTYTAYDPDSSSTTTSLNVAEQTKTVDLSGYEFPSTESTDAQYGGSQQTLSYSSTSDTAPDFTVAGVSYELTTGGNLRLEGLDISGVNPNGVAAATILPENENDNEVGYVFEHGYDSKDEELDTQSLAQAPSLATSTQTTLESDDDISAGYDFYGTYHEVDSDGQGSVTLNIPYGQSVAGAAVTSTEGSLEEGGGAGSATTQTATYGGQGFPAQSFAALDSEVTAQQRNNQNMILVGGPAVNSLVEELASENKTMTGSEYSQGDSMVQLIEGAFSEGNDALVVAGYSADDTRQAARYISNYGEHKSELSGQSKVMVSTGSSGSQ